MRQERPLSLKTSISGHLRPGACVSITSEETITTPAGCCGVIGIRKSWGAKGLTLGATIVPPNYTGTVEIQLINHSDETIEILKGEELVNIEYLAVYAG